MTTTDAGCLCCGAPRNQCYCAVIAADIGCVYARGCPRINGGDCVCLVTGRTPQEYYA
jgi:hypothetical protein